MKRKPWNPVVTTLLAAVLVARAAADDVDDLVEGMMAQYRIPGVALAVVKDSNVVKLAGYGQASVELDVPVTPDMAISCQPHRWRAVVEPRPRTKADEVTSTASAWSGSSTSWHCWPTGAR